MTDSSSTVEEAILRRLCPDQRVLDVGCANGRLTVALAQRVGARATGVDVSDALFPDARRAAREASVGRRMRCLKEDAHRMSTVKDRTFDAAIVVDTLHHLERPDDVLGEVHRVLKPGGRVMIAEMERRPDEPINNCLRFTRDELTVLLAEAGFRDLELEVTETHYLVAIARRGPGTGWRRDNITRAIVDAAR